MAERNEKGQFVKGGVGNPKGRPKKAREDRYYEIAMSAVPFAQWKRIFNRAATQAEKGDAQARKFLADYLLGSPVQRHELTGAEGGPIETTGGTAELLAAIERELEATAIGKPVEDTEEPFSGGRERE